MRQKCFLFISITLLTGCATQSVVYVSQSEFGFWWGVWHGYISPIALVVSWFSDKRIYAFPNAGVGYDVGFLIGTGGIVKTLELLVIPLRFLNWLLENDQDVKK